MSHLYESAGTGELPEWNAETGPGLTLYHAYWEGAYNSICCTPAEGHSGSLASTLSALRQAGEALPPIQRTQVERLCRRLHSLCRQFAKNVFDATRGWVRKASLQELQGLPPASLAAAARAAECHGMQGYLITLDKPLYNAVMTHADSRPLRKEVYRAFCTRASNTGPCAKRWDNSPLIAETLAVRHQLARLLGLANYAEYALQTQMPTTPQTLIACLGELAEKSLLQAMCEFAELTDFAREKYHINNLEAWDLDYVSEKLRMVRCPLSHDALRPYFPAQRVVDGLFTIVNRLYGFDVYQQRGVHSDQQRYLLYKHDTLIASFDLNLFTRHHPFTAPAGNGVPPVTYLACNFTPPAEHHPLLLSHNEVIILFRTFGKGLYRMLNSDRTTSVNPAPPPPDSIGLPERLFEHWCWQKEVLPLISAHYVTAEPLPESLLEALRGARNFQSGMQMLKQLELALFDFRLHLEYDSDNPRDPQALLNEIRRQIAVAVAPDFNRFQHSFSPAFACGSAALYYRHLWSQMLSCDAFSLFEDNGIFNRQCGERFLHEILHYGGTPNTLHRYIDFRGRAPKPAALLRHWGIGFK